MAIRALFPPALPINPPRQLPALIGAALAALLLVTGGAPLSAQTAPGGRPRTGIPVPAAADFPSLTPDPAAAAYARQSQIEATVRQADHGASPPVFWKDLTRMSLWASGVPDAALSSTALPDLAQPLVQAATELAAGRMDNAPLPSDLAARGEALLSFMHQRFLTTYAADQTRLDTLLTTGSFNCVSSAVLYMILATAAGLDAQGVITKDHAFVTIGIPAPNAPNQRGAAPRIDVETTNPYGFNPGKRTEFQDGAGNVTGFAYVPPGNYRNRAPISQVELVSLIFSNRLAALGTGSTGVDSLSSADPRGNTGDTGLALSINRAALLRGRVHPVSSPFFADPEQDLMDRLINYGAVLANQGQEARALQWAAYASDPYPSPRWGVFTYQVLNNLVVKLVQALQFDDAAAALASHRAVLTTQQAAALGTVIALKQVEALSREQDWERALAIIDAAQAEYGTNPQFDQVRRIIQANQVVTIHNTFAEHFNHQDYDDARSVLMSGLNAFPQDRQLRADLKLLEQAVGRNR